MCLHGYKFVHASNYIHASTDSAYYQHTSTFFFICIACILSCRVYRRNNRNCSHSIRNKSQYMLAYFVLNRMHGEDYRTSPAQPYQVLSDITHCVHIHNVMQSWSCSIRYVQYVGYVNGYPDVYILYS